MESHWNRGQFTGKVTTLGAAGAQLTQSLSSNETTHAWPGVRMFNPLEGKDFPIFSYLQVTNRGRWEFRTVSGDFIEAVKVIF